MASSILYNTTTWHNYGGTHQLLSELALLTMLRSSISLLSKCSDRALKRRSLYQTMHSNDLIMLLTHVTSFYKFIAYGQYISPSIISNFTFAHVSQLLRGEIPISSAVKFRALPFYGISFGLSLRALVHQYNLSIYQCYKSDLCVFTSARSSAMSGAYIDVRSNADQKSALTKQKRAHIHSVF